MFLQVKKNPVGSQAVKFFITDENNEIIFVGKPMINDKATLFIGAISAIVLAKKGTYTMKYGAIEIQKSINANTIIVNDADVYKWISDKKIPDELFKMVKNDPYTALSLKKSSLQLIEFKRIPTIKLL